MTIPEFCSCCQTRALPSTSICRPFGKNVRPNATGSLNQRIPSWNRFTDFNSRHQLQLRSATRLRGLRGSASAGTFSTERALTTTSYSSTMTSTTPSILLSTMWVFIKWWRSVLTGVVGILKLIKSW